MCEWAVWLKVNTGRFQLESCLKHIFAKYCTPKASAQTHRDLLEPPEGAYLAPEGLDSWAQDTNGTPFDDATKEELLEFMDVTDDGGLTLVLSFSFACDRDIYPRPDSRALCKCINCRQKTTKKRPGEISLVLL